MKSLEDLDKDVGSLQDKMRQMDEKIEVLYGEHVHLIGGEITPTGEIVQEPHADIVAAEGPPPGQSVSEWISGLFGSPGIVIDEGRALSTPCIKIELGEGRRPLVYSHGIMGALDDEQKQVYCVPGYIEHEVTPKQRERLATMEVASKKCSAETTGEAGREHIQRFFTCLSKELKSNGQEAW